ncbi:flagellar hook-length control protein FliK [Aliihoeflea sp. PC F10.4]
MPQPTRSTDARHLGKNTDERGFGDILERDGLNIRDAGNLLVDDEIAALDPLGDKLDPDAMNMDLKTEPGLGDADSITDHVDDQTPSAPLRLFERIGIDWLALRMPGRAASESGDKTTPTDEIIPSVDDGTDISIPVVSSKTAPDGDDGSNIASQIAVTPARSETRLIDGEKVRRPLGERTAATVENLSIAQFRSNEASTMIAVEPTNDRKPDLKVRTALERLDSQTDTNALRAPAPAIGSVSLQTVPAPALELQTPARTVIAALSEAAPEPARPVTPTLMQQQASEPMRILRIQLHPLELGMVTAKLSLQGGAMAVELQTETRDAATRLATDSNDIVKALRGLGIEVDRVTVTQSSQPAAQQPDQQAGNFERNERFADDASGRDTGRDQRNGSARGETAQIEERDIRATPDRAGVFI